MDRTQKEDAKLFGIEYTAFNKAINGKRRVPLKKAELVSRLTGISLQDLLFKDLKELSKDLKKIYQQ